MFSRIVRLSGSHLCQQVANGGQRLCGALLAGHQAAAGVRQRHPALIVLPKVDAGQQPLQLGKQGDLRGGGMDMKSRITS